MLFNSLEFLAFLPVVFFVHWVLIPQARGAQNLTLLVASYVFYASWDVRFLPLIIGSSLVDFFVGRALGGATTDRKRKLLLATSLSANLGVLGFFKYFNFFADSFVEFAGAIGFEPSWTTINIVLPVGISFYTFQTLSYTIDIYRRQLEPTDDLLDFLTFVSFFPQLVAGPIERAADLLPRFARTRRFDSAYAASGLRRILWGLIKKVVVADGAAIQVDAIFASYETTDSLTLAIGAFLFAIQIYGDFSGYSDMAIGCARLFGIELMENFRFPYFATSFQDFWQRWHISLSTWFRDYLYIPLGGSRGGRSLRVRNLSVVFLVSGLWHGAGWTFVMWGALHALYYVPETLIRGRGWKPSPILRWAAVFALVNVAWVFFRAPSIGDAFGYLERMATGWPVELPDGKIVRAVLLGVALLVAELAYSLKPERFTVSRWPIVPRRIAYYAGLMVIFALGTTNETPFIYFQF